MWVRALMTITKHQTLRVNLKKKKLFKKFFLDPSPPPVHHPPVDSSEPSLYNLEHVLSLESWLTFKGSFNDMQALVRLRFKLMSYFLNILKNPLQLCETEDLV